MSDDAWPNSLDALIAALRHHTLVLENDMVRVFETRIPAGDTVPVHTHQWPSIYCITSWSDFVRRNPQGNVLLDTRVAKSEGTSPTAFWSEPLPPHSLENVGTTEIRLVSIDLKQLARSTQL